MDTGNAKFRNLTSFEWAQAMGKCEIVKSYLITEIGERNVDKSKITADKCSLS